MKRLEASTEIGKARGKEREREVGGIGREEG